MSISLNAAADGLSATMQLGGVDIVKLDANKLAASTGKSIEASTVKGTTTNDNAAAGMVGEYVEQTATGVAVVSGGTNVNVTSILLSAGDWDVAGVVRSVNAGTATISQLSAGTSITSATHEAYCFQNIYCNAPSGGNITLEAPVVRRSFAAPTTVYLIGSCSYAVAGVTLSGRISARRVR